jgi:hypothetical protein
MRKLTAGGGELDVLRLWGKHARSHTVAELQNTKLVGLETSMKRASHQDSRENKNKDGGSRMEIGTQSSIHGNL